MSQGNGLGSGCGPQQGREGKSIRTHPAPSHPVFIPPAGQWGAGSIGKPSIWLQEAVTAVLLPSNKAVTHRHPPAFLIYGPDIGSASSHKPEK